MLPIKSRKLGGLEPKRPTLRLPPIRAGVYDNFRLSQEPWLICPEARESGYFSDEVTYPQAWVAEDIRPEALLNGKHPRWVINNPVETQTTQLALYGDWAGHVLVLGLPNWIFLYHLLARDKVKRVTLIEQDSAQLAFFKSASSYKTWPGANKLTLRDGPWLDQGLQRKHIDQLYYAGATKLTEPQFKQVMMLAAFYKPKWLYYWGQEVDYALYCMSSQVTVSEQSWRQFQKTLGTSLHPPKLGNYLPLIPRILQRFTSAPTFDITPKEAP